MQQLELFPLNIEESKQIILNISSREWFQLREDHRDLYDLLKPIRAELKRREAVIKREQDHKQRADDRRRKYEADVLAYRKHLARFLLGPLD